MGDIIRFPTLAVELTEEEIILFEQYREGVKNANSFAEMNYNFSQAKILIQKAKERKE
ncbi:TPA: hypothetical protein ACGW5B_005523 [Bacillus paranthracis]|uniref:hypothetical protein n=1 Tax=Bacillus cereus group TaxID=86661 RepID=UPI0015818AC2|nr:MULTISPECIES: hypothetical protein [Bacillus cereus group]MDX5839909.1 hypothetical protein [Bacillus cereus group sp. BfR-BA-01700]MDX5846225.1 hypothetical protein [Bacillus cereus group sp. BfR-BA-01233]MDX5941861.1 hypothetical protein [Bacillus cereus group sp. BfR-BA-00415]NUJ08497.1 hypothetical protein [Bacillus paranthracis]